MTPPHRPTAAARAKARPVPRTRRPANPESSVKPERGTPRRLTRREELGVESRRRIVDAAAALMAERRFAGTSIAAVSERSGLPSGSIYWHFDSKESLLGAVVEEGARRWFDNLPGTDHLPSDPAQRAEAIAGALVTSLEDHPEFLRLLLLIALERREVDGTSLAVIRLASEFAPFVLCVADGAFVARHIDPDTDLRQVFDLMRRALETLARDIVTDATRPRRR